jgi:hypothetical protein
MTRRYWLCPVIAILSTGCARGHTALTSGTPSATPSASASATPSPAPSPGPSAPGSLPLLPLPGPGVRGQITAGPTCPVERVGQPCPPQPVKAAVTASDSAGAIVGTTRTLPDGRYALALAPGRYTLTADPGNVFPRCPPTLITVPAGAPVEVNIICDTGIR